MLKVAVFKRFHTFNYGRQLTREYILTHQESIKKGELLFQRKSFITNSCSSSSLGFLLKNSSFPHFFLLCIISGNYFSCISGLYSCSVCSLAVPLMSTEVARYRFASFARNNLVIGNSRLQSVCNVYEIIPKALLWEKSLLTSLYMCINREWRLDRRWSVRRRHCTWACTETCGWLRNRDTR